MTRIIRARIEETLELDPRPARPSLRLCADRRQADGADRRRSQLTGLPEAARRILARNVRIGRPLGVAGLPEAAKGPAFATAVGLLIYPQVAASSQIEARARRSAHDRARAGGSPAWVSG